MWIVSGHPERDGRRAVRWNKAGGLAGIRFRALACPSHG
jgi:hypothetical protein